MRLLSLLLALPALLLDHPAQAKDPAPLSASGPVLQGSAPGLRVIAGENGFRLNELGFWDPPKARVDLPKYKTGPQPRSPSLRPTFRRAAFYAQVRSAETRYSLPRGLLDALVWTESRYDPAAISTAGAIGLGQLMPGTAQGLGVTNRYEPLASIDGAARYLRQLLDRFGAIHLALAAYNAGPRAVERSRGIPRNGETPIYVRRVLESWSP